MARKFVDLPNRKMLRFSSWIISILLRQWISSEGGLFPMSWVYQIQKQKKHHKTSAFGIIDASTNSNSDNTSEPHFISVEIEHIKSAIPGWGDRFFLKKGWTVQFQALQINHRPVHLNPLYRLMFIHGCKVDSSI